MSKDNTDRDNGAITPASMSDKAAIQAYKRAFARSGGIGRAKALPSSKRTAIARAAGVASGAARRAKSAESKQHKNKESQTPPTIQNSKFTGKGPTKTP